MDNIWRRAPILVLAALTLVVVLPLIVHADPSGANLTVTNISRRTDTGTAGSVSAQAGNVTELNIEGFSITRFWQGFYGNVSGTIQLANAAGQSMYRWVAASPRGEIYATRNSSSINWSGVGCANESQVRNEDVFVGADSAQTVDSVNRTFNYTGHPAFSIAGRQVANCRSVSVNGTGNGDAFWETLLVDNGTQETMNDDIMLYTGLIDQDRIGFNGNLYDFQMLVGEPGNGSEEYPNGNPTTYYFYVEID